MSPFEFVAVLISIILGLGITQLMSGVANLIHQWKEVRLYGPHLVWIILVFILHVQDWWLLYELRNMARWELPMFLFQILYPISLFVLARVLFPMGTETDMKSYYLANYRKFFALVMVLSFLSAVQNVLFHHLGNEGWFINAALFFGFYALFSRQQLSERVHQVLSIILLILMIAGILYNMNDWLISS
jgi:hypothetical protein